MSLNRAVALAVALLALVAGLAPVIANFDWTSTAGVIAGLAAVSAVANKWLDGWQKHEDREAGQKVKLDVSTDADDDVDDELAAELDELPVTANVPRDKGDAGTP